jgi:hypothetical protein
MAAVERELALLANTLAAVSLSLSTDERWLVLCAGPKSKLSTGTLYKLCRFGGISSPNAEFI